MPILWVLAAMPSSDNRASERGLCPLGYSYRCYQRVARMEHSGIRGDPASIPDYGLTAFIQATHWP
jgi:hypothetical protein